MADDPCATFNPSSPCYGVANVFKYSSWAKDIETKILAFTNSVGIQCTVTSRVRTCQEQCRLFVAGKTTAQPNTSQHEWGYAFDVVPVSGFSQYGATKRDAIVWLVALSEYYGGYGLAESDHAHLTVWSNASWRAWLIASGLLTSIPIPGKRR